MLIKVLTIPEDRNVFVVGDIHGMYDLFITTLKKMNFNFEKDLCISVGDLVDRGEQSQQCVSLLDEPWFEAAEGNHEHFCVQGLETSFMKSRIRSHVTAELGFINLNVLFRK